MTKVTMPEPVAWTVTVGEDFRNCIEITHCKVDAEAQYEASTEGGYEDLYMLRSLITTTQAEAYKDACVREALEALNNQAQELYESSLKSRLARDGAADEDELKAIDLWNVESVGMAKAYTNMQKAIRALIPPTE